MLDVIFVVVTIVFFALGVWYVAGCEKLGVWPARESGPDPLDKRRNQA